MLFIAVTCPFLLFFPLNLLYTVQVEPPAIKFVTAQPDLVKYASCGIKGEISTLLSYMVAEPGADFRQSHRMSPYLAVSKLCLSSYLLFTFNQFYQRPLCEI